MHININLDGDMIEEYCGNSAVFKKEHKGRTVAMKMLRLFLTSDLDKCIGVSTITLRIPEPNTRITEILQRSCYMEASPTREHTAIVGCESKSRNAPICNGVRMDDSR